MGLDQAGNQDGVSCWYDFATNHNESIYRVSDWTGPTHGTRIFEPVTHFDLRGSAGFTAVLAKCDIFVSKTTLGNAPDLEKMAKEDFVSAMTSNTIMARI